MGDHYELGFNEITGKYHLYKNDEDIGEITSEQLKQAEKLSSKQGLDMNMLLRSFKS